MMSSEENDRPANGHSSGHSHIAPDPDAFSHWLERQLRTARSSSAPAGLSGRGRSPAAGSVLHEIVLAFTADIGELRGDFRPIVLCFEAIDSLLHEVGLSYEVRRIRYENPLAVDLAVEAANALRAGGALGVAGLIVLAVERLAPLVRDFRSTQRLNDVAIEEERAKLRALQAKARRSLNSELIDENLHRRRVEIEQEVREAEARKAIAIEEFEADRMAALAKIVAQLDDDDVDLEAAVERFQAISDLNLDVRLLSSHESRRAAAESNSEQIHTSTDLTADKDEVLDLTESSWTPQENGHSAEPDQDHYKSRSSGPRARE